MAIPYLIIRMKNAIYSTLTTDRHLSTQKSSYYHLSVGVVVRDIAIVTGSLRFDTRAEQRQRHAIADLSELFTYFCRYHKIKVWTYLQLLQ